LIVKGRPRRRVWIVATALYTVAIFVAGTIEGAPSQVASHDKVAHAGVFGLYFLLLAASARHLDLGTAVSRRGAAAVALAAGGLLELMQALLPHRSAELWDFLADALGIALGWGCLAAWERFRRRRR
jgi:VanZ family protein